MSVVTRILAIDPGPMMSAYALLDVAGRHLHDRGKVSNRELADLIWEGAFDGETQLAVEMIASYGMPVGAEVFETCVWIGRFEECWLGRTGVVEAVRVFRRDVKLHLCGSARAKDPNVRQALIDRYGGRDAAIGRKATPGPLHGVSGDVWSALAVAVTVADTGLAASAEAVA